MTTALKQKLKLLVGKPFSYDYQITGIKLLEKYLGASWVKSYANNHFKAEIFISHPMKYLDPRELILLGNNLKILSESIPPEEFKKVIRKLKNINIDNIDNASQLEDVLAEVNTIMIFVGNGILNIEVDKPTGVEGKNGPRNADCYLKDYDTFVEVKKYSVFKKNIHVKFISRSRELFSDSNNFGKFFQLGRNNFEIISEKQIGSGGQAMYQIGPGKQKNYVKSLIEKAKQKFQERHSVMLVIDGVPDGKLVHAVANKKWLNDEKIPFEVIAYRTPIKWGEVTTPAEFGFILSKKVNKGLETLILNVEKGLQ